MPRKLSGPKPGSLLRFTPDLPGEPMTVIIRAPSEAEKRKYLNDITSEIETDGKTARFSFADAHERREKAILGGWIVSVENLVDQEDVPVTTAQELWEKGDEVMLKKIAQYLEDLLALSADEKKSSSESPASQPPATPPSNGTAETAGSAASAPPATATGPTATPSSATS